MSPGRPSPPEVYAAQSLQVWQRFHVKRSADPQHSQKMTRGSPTSHGNGTVSTRWAPWTHRSRVSGRGGMGYSAGSVPNFIQKAWSRVHSKPVRRASRSTGERPRSVRSRPRSACGRSHRYGHLCGSPNAVRPLDAPRVGWQHGVCSSSGQRGAATSFPRPQSSPALRLHRAGECSGGSSVHAR